MKTRSIWVLLALGLLTCESASVFSQGRSKGRPLAPKKSPQNNPIPKVQLKSLPTENKTIAESPPKREPQRLYTPLSFLGGFMRERTELLETASGRFEPLFNDLFLGGIGSSIFYRLNAQFDLLFPIFVLGGISKLGNADPTPATVVTQTPTLAFGLSGGPGLGWRFYRSPGFFVSFLAGGVAVLRYQKFASHPEGVIQTKSLGILPGISAGFKIGIGKEIQLDLIYSALRIDFLQPHASLGLSFIL